MAPLHNNIRGPKKEIDFSNKTKIHNKNSILKSIWIFLYLFIYLLTSLLIYHFTQLFFWVTIWLILGIPTEIALGKIIQPIMKKMKYWGFNFLTYYPKYHSLILRRLSYYTGVPIIEYFDKRYFHFLFRLPWEDLRVLLKIIYLNPNYNYAICPYALNLLENCKIHHFSITTMRKITQFYSESILSLIHKYLRNSSLNPHQKERIIFETVGDSLLYLEKHLAPSDPFLIKIQKQSKIKIDSQYSILR